MRPISNKNLRRVVNLEALNAANDAVGRGEVKEWDEFLRSHPTDSTSLRTGLWAVSCMKCWYSEAIIQQGEGHIEHYRPKGQLSGATHSGYKWRAFDWRNLRLAHSTVNLRRTDYLTKRKAGKGSYFPLRDPANRATSAVDESAEEPVLIDPIVSSDTLLIYFDEPSGAPRARFEKEDNEWLNRRALDSIDYYHLNEGTWNGERADLMAAVRKLCVQLLEITMVEPRDEAAYGNKISEIIERINPFAEFSSACLQVVREMGLLEYFVPGPR